MMCLIYLKHKEFINKVHDNESGMDMDLAFFSNMTFQTILLI